MCDSREDCPRSEIGDGGEDEEGCYQEEGTLYLINIIPKKGVDQFLQIVLISCDRSSCSRPLTTISHDQITLLKVSLQPPHAPEKFGTFMPVYIVAKSITNVD